MPYICGGCLDTDEVAIQEIFREITPRFGVNHARVYRCVLSTQAKTARQVIEQTGIYRPVVYRTLKDLINFGLVKQLPCAPAMFFAHRPVQRAGVLVNRRKRELDNRITELKKIIGNATSLSGEEYLISIDGGQRLLINRKTHTELKDEQRLREIKATVEGQLAQIEQKKIKPWAVYR